VSEMAYFPGSGFKSVQTSSSPFLSSLVRTSPLSLESVPAKFERISSWIVDTTRR